MTAHDLARIIADAIAADASLAAWVSATYPGFALTTFLGADPADLPGKSDAPYVQAAGLGQSAGQVSERTWSVRVVLGLRDQAKTTTGNRVEYPGEARLWEFHALALALAFAAVQAHTTSFVAESEVSMPESGFYELAITLNLGRQWSFGQPTL